MVRTKMRVMPNSQYFLGINVLRSRLVKDVRNYSTDDQEKYPLVWNVEIGLLFVIFEFLID